MALYSKKEFAGLCGIPTNALAVYVKRGKVVLSGESVDDSHPANASFLSKQSSKKEIQLPTVKEVVTVQDSVSKVPPTSKAKDPDNKQNGSLYQLDVEKKSLDIQKTSEEIEILKVKKEKLHGILIPTELVKVLFAQHFKSVTTAFQHAADNLLMEVSKKKNLNRNEVAELRGKLVKIINKAVNDSIDDSKKNIKHVVSEYAEKRGVGERK